MKRIPIAARRIAVLALGSVVALGASGAFPSSAQIAAEPPAEGGAEDGAGAWIKRLSLGLSAGITAWDLASTEFENRGRAAELAPAGFTIQDDSFGPGLSVAAELRVRVRSEWYARAHAEYALVSASGDDRTDLAALGDNAATPVALTTETRAQFDPVVVGVGAVRRFNLATMNVGVGLSLLVVPARLKAESTVSEGAGATASEWNWSGVGLGGEATVQFEQRTAGGLNLFVELFGRLGRASADLEEKGFESEFVPATRTLDLSGGGARLGFRFGSGA